MNPEESTISEQPKLNELAPALPLEQPEPLLAFLAGRGIQTLADVRRAGDLGRIEGLPVASDHPAVLRLQALANLSAVSPDAGVSTALIERGYDSLLAIARARRTEFIAAVRDQVGDFKAARMHVEARAQTMYLNNALTGILAARANGHSIVPYGDVQVVESDVSPTKCGCKDCEAAVSPLAYLADLLDYAQKRIKKEQHGLKREYVIGSNPPLVQIDPVIDFHQDDENLPGFKVRWTGSIRPRYTERYTFYTRVDGFPGLSVTLWVNGQKLVDDDARAPDIPAEFSGTIDLKENALYDIKTEFDASDGVSGPSARLEWSSPRQPREVVPASQLLFTDPISIDLQFLADTFHQPFDRLPASCDAAGEQMRQARLCIEVLRSYLTSLAGLKAEYYDDTNFSTLKMTRVDPTVDFEWGTGSPDKSIEPDTFSVRWTGQIIPQFSDTYTFTTTSDDGVRLWIDGQKIIENWTVHPPTDNRGAIALTAGKAYDLNLEFYEDQGGATIKLFWQRPNEGKEIVPASQLRPFSVAQSANLEKAEKDYLLAAYTSLLTRLGTSFAEIRLARSADAETRKALADRLGIDLDLDPANGLKGEYYGDIHFNSLNLTRRDQTIDFEWQLGSPDPSIAPDHFAVRWRGQIEPEFSETYTFYTISDDGARLWVNGKLLIDNWTVHPPTENSGTIDLIGGQRYDMMLEYYENEGGATIKLLWSSLSQSKEVIPQDRLYSDPTNRLDALLLDPDAVQTKPETLTEEKLEVLFGLRNTDRDSLTEPPTSLVQQWRLDHLRTLWREQDWPTDPYSQDYQPQDERVPIFDPDLIGLDDFRHRDLEPATTPFAIWKARRDWVDLQIQTLAAIQKARPKGNQPVAVPDLNGIFNRMYQPVTYGSFTITPWANTAPVTDFNQLYRKLTGGTADEVKDTRERIKKDLGLTPEAFGRLMEIRAKEKLSWVDSRNETVQDDEWQELYSILVQVQKTRLFASWIAEETSASISFGLGEFWNSLHGPKEGDWPPVYVVQHVLNQPVIDPELIESNELPMAGTAAVVLWQARRAKLDQMHTALKAERKSPTGGFDAMLRLALGAPNPGDPLPLSDAELNTLYDNLKTGVNTDSSRETIRTSLYMTGDSFLRLMDIKKKDADAGTGNKPTEAEYEEVYTILTSAQKAKREYQGWLEEEKKLPLIDPVSVKLEDLPDDMAAGTRANSLWNERKQELDDYSRTLKEKREDPAGGFDAVLTFALGLNPGPLPTPGSITLNTLIMLYNNLNAGNDLENTQATITTRLHMTVEDFTRVMTVRAKDHASAPPKPTTSEYAEAYAILTTAQKIGTSYSVWASEENRPQKGTSLDYHQAFKARLPRWRANAEARQQWKQALRTRSSAPIIDLDLIGPGDLKHPVKNDAAFDLWTSRNSWLSNTDPPGLWQKLQAAQASGGLDAMIELETVKPASDLWKLDAERNKGNDIASRLEQFGLDNPSFSYLLRICKLIADNQAVLSAEWDAVYSILVQVSKRRMFAEWREQERQAGLTVSPDFFRFPEEDKTIFPPPPPPWEPVPWRSTREMRRDWQDTLQSRMDQEQAVKDALQSVVSATEEATLPMLRDALIMATDADGVTLDAKAKWITDRLLVDTRVNGCQMTTRVAQAIETIQGLLWSLRTRQLRDTYPDLDLVAPDFDEEWEWIGSYASWRAAMFVFMYPENILLPSLRKHQTPAFRTVVNELRNNRRLTPEQACQAAEAYSNYFRDVCSLKLEACTKASVGAYSGDCTDHADKSYGDLTFLFARSPVSRTAYWCTRDAQAIPDSQTYWDQIPGLQEVTGLIGAVVRDPDPSTRDGNKPPAKDSFIYLFASIRKDNQQKLVLIKYSLESGRWDSEPIELKPPKSDTPYTLVRLKQAQPFQQPYVGIWYGDDEAYGRMLNEKGDDWAGDAFDNVLFVMNFGIQEKVTPSDLTRYGADLTQVNGRFYAINRYTHDRESTYAAGYPTFHEDQNGYATAFLTLDAVLWRNLYKHADLGLPPGDDAPNGRERIRSVNIYARNHGFVGGFPNFEQGYEGEPGEENIVYGSYLLKKEAAEFRIVPRATLQNAWSPNANLEDVEDRFRAVDSYATQNGFLSGFPTFIDYIDQPPAQYLGIVLIKKSLKVVKDLEPYVPPCSYSGFAPKAIPIQITEKLTKDQLDARKELSRTTYLANDPGPRSNLDYIKEAWYLVPLYLALQLQARGQYMAALDWFRTIYDYSAPLNQRKIYYGLIKEGKPDGASSQHPDWSDPLNPHSIAETRPNTYTRYTLFSLIRCFLEYADAEFTRDTAESVPRARTLYLTALELLDTLQDAQQPEPCEARIRELDAQVYQGILSEAPQWLPVWFEIKRELAAIPDLDEFKKVVDGTNANGVSDALGKRPWSSALSLAWQRIRDAEAAPPATLTMAEVLHDKTRLLDKAYTVLMANPALAQASLAVGSAAGNRFLQSISTASGISAATLASERMDLLWLRNPFMNLANGQRALTAAATTAPSIGVSVNTTQDDVQPSFGYVPILSFQFCIPPNPVLNALKLHAELNLYKLRNCRNIAGMQRQLDPYAAPTDTKSGLPTIGAGGQLILPGTTVLHPTPYRYKVLIERAKQLASIAQQMEAAMLSALEKRDVEAYNLLKARQDVRMARAGVQLQDLRIQEAQSGKRLAELQLDRAILQSNHFQKLLEDDLLPFEKDTLGLLLATAALHSAAAGAETVAASFHFAAAYGPNSRSEIGSAWSAIGSALSSTAALASTMSSYFSTRSSFERRKQDWEFQRELANQDINIGNQQVKAAEDHVRVVGQERAIAEMQRDHAEAMVEFLSTKFTNVELYEWMSGVLENVYSFFLQQATSVAKLAENQLAFERQETPPSHIQSDYWEAPSDEMGTSGDGRVPDRHGLTGSARLLQDIYQLDQYAFENDKRKLQLSKTISLARMAPYEFQRFRETGVLNFGTSLDLFDRDFPGQYLRLIKRVRTSVVALIPPTQGIHATLTNGGQSRVVIGPEVFQTVVVRRDPESVALTAPINASGLFELEPQSDMLFPFESLGVGTTWEFRLPQAANLFDYNTIADVLLTIEYTALDNFDYRQQVIQTLPPMTSGDRPFSFRQEFADAWYDLHNPDQATPPPMTVTFETRREDFPPNIADLKIQHILLYFACTDGNVFEENVTLKFKAKGEANAVGGEAKPNDGVISTRRGNAGSWLAMTDKKSPAGVWTLSLQDTLETRKLFTDEVIEDMLLVITYSGRTPEWPA